MKNIYFVDYENVSFHGIEGMDQLDKNDLVYIFYSKNAKSINIDHLHLLTNAKCKYEFIEITNLGKDALDFQMCTIIGLFIGKYIGKDLFIKIISCDHCYDIIKDMNKIFTN